MTSDEPSVEEFMQVLTEIIRAKFEEVGYTSEEAQAILAPLTSKQD